MSVCWTRRVRRSPALRLPISPCAKTVSTREVLEAEPATDPMQIVLIVDDSQAATTLSNPSAKG